MPVSDDMVKKTLLVPRDLDEEFRLRHPGHGDFTWFVRAALEKYLEVNQIDAEELVKLAVGELDLKP